MRQYYLWSKRTCAHPPSLLQFKQIPAVTQNRTFFQPFENAFLLHAFSFRLRKLSSTAYDPQCSVWLRLAKLCGIFKLALLPIAQRLQRRVPPRSSSHAATGMRSRSTQIKPANRSAILRPTGHGTHKEELLQSQVAVKNIALSQSVCSLQVERCQHLSHFNRSRYIGCVFGDLFHHAIAQQVPLLIPVALAQLVGHILHKARQNMLARRSQ